jgi:hypothetical protein
MAVHAQAFYLIDDFGVFVVVACFARVCDLAAHVREKIFGEAQLWVCHGVWCMCCGDGEYFLLLLYCGRRIELFDCAASL